MISIPVKVSGITSLTDARYCAGMGVQYLGIQLDEKKSDRMSSLEFNSIRSWIEGIEWVGEYTGSSLADVSEIAKLYDLHFWEVQDLALAKLLKREGYRVALDIIQNPPMPIDYKELEYVSLTLPQLGTNFSNGSFLLKGISTFSDLKSRMDAFPVCGFSFRSGEEERPGWMDLSHLQEMLEILDSD